MMKVKHPVLERIGLVSSGVAMWGAYLLYLDPRWMRRGPDEVVVLLTIAAVLVFFVGVIALSYRICDQEGPDPILSFSLAVLKTVFKFAVVGALFPILLFMIKGSGVDKPACQKIPTSAEIAAFGESANGAVERPAPVVCAAKTEKSAGSGFLQLIVVKILMSLFSAWSVGALRFTLGDVGRAGIVPVMALGVIIGLVYCIWTLRFWAYNVACVIMGIATMIALLHTNYSALPAAMGVYGTSLILMLSLVVWVKCSKAIADRLNKGERK